MVFVLKEAPSSSRDEFSTISDFLPVFARKFIRHVILVTLNSPKDFASACASVTNFGCVPWLEILQIRPQVPRPYTQLRDRWDHYFWNIYNTYL